MFLYPEEIDERLSWHPGTAARMARRRRLPHVILPDGSIRFVWAEIEALLVRVLAMPIDEPEQIRGGGPNSAA